MIQERIDLSVNFEYYKVFYVVAKKLNITKAAEELFVSQPAVTQTINKLEVQLGQKLFLRSNKGLLLTNFGKEVFLKVESAVLMLSQIKPEAENFEGLKQGSLIVGAGTHITKAVLSSAMSEFANKYPNIVVAIKDNKKSKMLQMLASGQIDIFVSNNLGIDDDKFEFISLFKDRRVFVASKEFALNNKVFDLEFLAKSSLITLSKGSSSRQELDETTKRKNITFAPKLEVEGYSSVINMVNVSYGVGFLPEFLVKEEIKSGKFVVLDVGYNTDYIEYGMILNKNYKTKATKVFVDMVKAENNKI